MSSSRTNLASENGSLSVNLDVSDRKVDYRQILARPQPATRHAPKYAINQHKNKRKYFTSRSWVDEHNQRDVLNEPSPFHYPQEVEELAHSVMTKTWRQEQRDKEFAGKFYERHTNQSRQNVDLLNRLYVDEPEIKNALWMQDIAPEFYTVIEGRPVAEKLKLRAYIEMVREVLKTKIVAGYRGDDILLLEQNLTIEQKNINEIEKNYHFYQSSFEAFLYKDHCESMKLLNEADKQSGLARDKYEEFRELSKQYGALKAIVSGTEEKWRTCKSFQRFLYLVSPMWWRRDHDFYYRRELEHEGSESGKGTQLDEVASLEELIGQFQEDVRTQEDPILYFTDPQQLLDVFKFIELQNLNSLMHSEDLAAPLEQVKENMALAVKQYGEEISALEELIDKLEGGIKWEEERAQFLEELALELVGGEFRDLVVAEDILNLHVFVEDVYETRIGPNDANLPIGEMMKMIETKFRDELITLDQLPAEQVTKLEQSCYKEEGKMLKEAQKAARKLYEFEMLFQKMEMVFAPRPPVRTQRELKWRSPPYNPPRVVPPPPRELTKEEQDYLQFFTDYCHHTDTPQQYGIDVTPLKKLSVVKAEVEDVAAAVDRRI